MHVVRIRQCKLEAEGNSIRFTCGEMANAIFINEQASSTETKEMPDSKALIQRKLNSKSSKGINDAWYKHRVDKRRAAIESSNDQSFALLSYKNKTSLVKHPIKLLILERSLRNGQFIDRFNRA